jgi:hypothetical protein
MEVTPPAGWAPAVVRLSAYQPMQAQARAGMRATLLRLIR